MGRLRSLVRDYWIDILVVIAAAVAAIQVAVSHDALRPRTSAWFAVPAIAAMILPLLGRRRFPFAAPAATWVIAAALSFIDGRLVVFAATATLAGMGASFMLGSLRDHDQSRLGLAIVLAGAAIVVYNDPHHAAGEIVFIPALFAMLWIAGFAIRERAIRAQSAEQRAIRAEHERETAARLAVAEERTRIARELHDIVAHAVSVMVLQVGAVRHNLAAAEQEDKDALLAVERAGRTALTDMRQLLDAMREDGESVELGPQPGLDRLEGLLREVDRAGLPVQLHVDGDALPLPRGIDISAYRIIQEGLTNALKHAYASHADVSLHYAQHQLSIEVRDDGRGAATRDDPGYGLVGIRERVKLYGGAMSAGDAAGGGFILTTSLPLPDQRP
jgi:signal transduction histidine kinase